MPGPRTMNGPCGTGQTRELSHQITYGLGASLAVVKERFDLVADEDHRYLLLGARIGQRVDALEAAVASAGTMYAADRLHAVRIAAKKVRYALEVDRELTRSRAMARINRLKALQDALGDIHDFEILVERIRDGEAAECPCRLPAHAENKHNQSKDPIPLA